MKSFFLVSGIILVVSGSLQALVRPRNADEGWASRWINRATIRALVFVLAGGLAVLVGSGWLPLTLPSGP